MLCFVLDYTHINDEYCNGNFSQMRIDENRVKIYTVLSISDFETLYNCFYNANFTPCNYFIWDMENCTFTVWNLL